MATISPTKDAAFSQGAKHTWTGMATGDTFTPIQPEGVQAIAASVQVTGTFGGGTVVVQGSNDGTNWVTVKNFQGDDVSLTAAGAVDFASNMQYLRPSTSGGTADSVTAVMVLRG